MNIENFKRLRDHVAANPKFGMHRMMHSCGSAACIMGSAESLILSETKDPSYNGAIYHDEFGHSRVCSYYIRAKWLDISEAEYDHIYFGSFSLYENMTSISQAEAVAYLDMCIDSGYVFLGRVAFVPEEML